jgi:hypothetical protein
MAVNLQIICGDIDPIYLGLQQMFWDVAIAKT